MHRLISIVLTLVVYLSTPAIAGIIATPSPQGISLKQLIPLSTWNKQFKITQGKDRGKVVPLTLHRDRGQEGRWNLVFGDYAGIQLRNDAGSGSKRSPRSTDAAVRFSRAQATASGSMSAA